MHVALLMVGAHNGQKQRDTILRAATFGLVILIEPVPYLFADLQLHYAGNPNIVCLNRCVATEAGEVSFFAPTEDATKVLPWADQLGSMTSDHAVHHEKALASHIVELRMDAVTLARLVEEFEISTLDVLFTDTEGHDVSLLSHFPFDRLRPNQIIFEYKHADGTFNVGRNLGRLLMMLDDLGYNMTFLDVENCMATLRR